MRPSCWIRFSSILLERAHFCAQRSIVRYWNEQYDDDSVGLEMMVNKSNLVFVPSFPFYRLLWIFSSEHWFEHIFLSAMISDSTV